MSGSSRIHTSRRDPDWLPESAFMIVCRASSIPTSTSLDRERRWPRSGGGSSCSAYRASTLTLFLSMLCTAEALLNRASRCWATAVCTAARSMAANIAHTA